MDGAKLLANEGLGAAREARGVEAATRSANTPAVVGPAGAVAGSRAGRAAGLAAVTTRTDRGGDDRKANVSGAKVRNLTPRAFRSSRCFIAASSN